MDNKASCSVSTQHFSESTGSKVLMCKALNEQPHQGLADSWRLLSKFSDPVLHQDTLYPILPDQQQTLSI